MPKKAGLSARKIKRAIKSVEVCGLKGKQTEIAPDGNIKVAVAASDDRRRDTKHREVGIEVIRSVVRSTPKVTSAPADKIARACSRPLQAWFGNFSKSSHGNDKREPSGGNKSSSNPAAAGAAPRAILRAE